jgi:hypothetical protein
MGGRIKVEVWHWLLGASLQNRVKRCDEENHFDSFRLAGCPPTVYWEMVASVSLSKSLSKSGSIGWHSTIDYAHAGGCKLDFQNA